MCDVTFVPGDAMERGESICRQMVMISLRGDPNIVVVVASDTRGSRALGAAFFGKKPTEVARQTVWTTAIAELLNWWRRRSRTRSARSAGFGLPSRTTLPEIAAGGGLRLDDARLMHSEGAIDLGFMDPRGPGGQRQEVRGSWRLPLTPAARCVRERAWGFGLQTSGLGAAGMRCRSDADLKPEA